VLRAVVDTALTHFGGTADATRVALLGSADGAALAVLGAAADDRISALVCDPGVIRPVDAALAQLPGPVTQAWSRGDDDGLLAASAAARADDRATAFTIDKIVESWPGHSLAAVLRGLAAWDVTPVVDRVTCPVLVCDPDTATAFPGQSAELADRLGGRATLVGFTSAEGAGLDCEIGAPLVRAGRIGDWLDDTVGHGRRS
jgi:hypothetical protein